MKQTLKATAAILGMIAAVAAFLVHRDQIHVDVPLCRNKDVNNLSTCNPKEDE